VRVRYKTTEFWAQSKEDFIIAKLVYGGYLDYKDAFACWTRFEEDLDVEYLSETAYELGVEDVWESLKEKKPVGDAIPD